MFISFSKEEQKELLMIKGYDADDPALEQIILTQAQNSEKDTGDTELNKQKDEKKEGSFQWLQNLVIDPEQTWAVLVWDYCLKVLLIVGYFHDLLFLAFQMGKPYS